MGNGGIGHKTLDINLTNGCYRTQEHGYKGNSANDQLPIIGNRPKASINNLANKIMAATLGAVARKRVTGVGAPSYTSGAHMWNGAAETLKANPTIRKANPNSNPTDVSPSDMASDIPLISVVPEKP